MKANVQDTLKCLQSSTWRIKGRAVGASAGVTDLCQLLVPRHSCIGDSVYVVDVTAVGWVRYVHVVEAGACCICCSGQLCRGGLGGGWDQQQRQQPSYGQQATGRHRDDAEARKARNEAALGACHCSRVTVAVAEGIRMVCNSSAHGFTSCMHALSNVFKSPTSHMWHRGPGPRHVSGTREHFPG